MEKDEQSVKKVGKKKQKAQRTSISIPAELHEMVCRETDNVSKWFVDRGWDHFKGVEEKEKETRTLDLLEKQLTQAHEDKERMAQRIEILERQNDNQLGFIYNGMLMVKNDIEERGKRLEIVERNVTPIQVQEKEFVVGEDENDYIKLKKSSRLGKIASVFAK